MLKKIILYIIFCFSFVFQSCENLNDPGEAEFKNSIIFKLQTGSAKQQLYVYHTLPLSFSINDPIFFENYTNPLADDAEISITNINNVYNDFKIEYRDTTKRHKYYTNNSDLFIEPGMDYSISVESNGETIIGNIKTVGDFEILDIAKLSSNEEDALFRVNWERCERARFYNILATYYYSDSIYYWIEPPYSVISRSKNYFVDIDTVSAINNLSTEFTIISQSDSLVVEIEAYDQNTYDYFIKKIKRVGIENAYGYLGSYTIKKKKIYFNNPQ